jgi:N-acetylgalactosamine-N,N'-diacetylbacillosaminyl-diphospho-undecaprenol 4-alpha-N-acetylgalactosaminyltransferase
MWSEFWNIEFSFIDDLVDRSQKVMSDEVRLITIGRLEMVKAQWHLIHAINDLRFIAPNISLTIIGRESLHSELIKLIEDIGLEQSVHLIGFQKDIARYLSVADIFVFSSELEGFPNVLLEAMSMGLPIISTDIPHGPREILNPSGVEIYSNDKTLLEDKYGLLVDYGTNPLSGQYGYRDNFIVHQFVEKISLFMENSELYTHFSEQSLKRVKNFSEEATIKQWIELFESQN